MPPAVSAETGRAWPMLDVSTLGDVLESVVDVRTWLRSDDAPALFPEKTPISCKGACRPQIHATLKVLLNRTVNQMGMPQPPIQPLRDELVLLYKKVGRTPDDSTIVSDSWYIRKFLSMVKMKTRKEKVSTESSLYNQHEFVRHGLCTHFWYYHSSLFFK